MASRQAPASQPPAGTTPGATPPTDADIHFMGEQEYDEAAADLTKQMAELQASVDA